MILIGGEYETAPADFAGNIGSSRGEVAFHASHHRRAVEVNAAVTFFQFLPSHFGNGAQHQGWRAFIDEALMARYGSHNLQQIIDAEMAGDNQVVTAFFLCALVARLRFSTLPHVPPSGLEPCRDGIHPGGLVPTVLDLAEVARHSRVRRS